jgi:hypothetical protein
MAARTFAGKVPIAVSAKSVNVLFVGGVPIGPGRTPGVQPLAGKSSIAFKTKNTALSRKRPLAGKAATAFNIPDAPLSLKVDLNITAVTTTPASPVAGDPVVFEITVRNTGTTAVPNLTNIGVGIYLDGNTPSNIITYTNMRDGLAGGASIAMDTDSGWAPGGAWFATQGVHTVRAWVDDQGLITEANEANNTFDFSLTVGAGTPQPGLPRLFRDSSAWNAVKNPQSFTYRTNADAFLASQGYGINNGPGFYVPCYFGIVTDPVQTFHIGAGWGFPARTETGKVANNIESPAGGDGNMDVVFDDGRALDMYQARYQGGNVWNVAMAVPFNAYTDFGFAQPDKGNNTPAGTTAIGCCQAGGGILKRDIQRGVINHGLRIAFDYSAMGNQNGTQVGYAISNDVGGGGGPIPEGALLMPAGAEPAGLSPWGHQLWLAAATYGVWVTDRLDGPPMIFGDGSPEVIGAFGHYSDMADITTVCRRLRLTNVGFSYPMPW